MRVRTGNSILQPWLGRSLATGVFSRGCIETKGFELAPQETLKYELSNGESGRTGILRLLTTRGNSEMRPSRMGVSLGEQRPRMAPGCGN